jgi:hypothetical protein
MKANIKNLAENLNVSHRKEKGFTDEYALITSDFRSPVTCRVYWRGSSCYCCLWVSGRDTYGTGSGCAKGGGYHKKSDAVARAIRSAGIELTDDDKSPARIGGSGDGAIFEAIAAIGRAVTRKKFNVFHAHA